MANLPKNNLAYPVLIVLSNGGSGTGVCINDGSTSYLATAKHVLYDQMGNLLDSRCTLKMYTEDLVINDFSTVDLDLVALHNNGELKAHASRDVCVVRILNNGNQTIGTNVSRLSTQGIMGVPLANGVKRFANVEVSNDVYIFGYPSSIGIKNSPQFSADTPLLRKGIVAGIARQTDSIILDCPVYKGNSGGPVLEVSTNGLQKEFRLIGVVSQFVPVEDNWQNMSFGLVNTQWSNSGYSIIEPFDHIESLISLF